METFNIVTVVLVAICIFNSKINVLSIISEHIKTYRNYVTKRISVRDVISFVLAPAGISCILTLAYGYRISTNETYVNVILTVLSIFAALLFNFLMIIIQLKETKKVFSIHEKDLTQRQKDYIQTIKETYYNVSFEILVSIVTIIIILVSIIVGPSSSIALNIINVILWFLIIVFFMNLCMILKRIFILYDINDI